MVRSGGGELWISHPGASAPTAAYVSQSVVVRIASATLGAVPFWDPEPGFWITKYRRAPAVLIPDWCSWCINGDKPGSAPRVALVLSQLGLTRAGRGAPAGRPGKVYIHTTHGQRLIQQRANAMQNAIKQGREGGKQEREIREFDSRVEMSRRASQQKPGGLCVFLGRPPKNKTPEFRFRLHAPYVSSGSTHRVWFY